MYLNYLCDIRWNGTCFCNNLVRISTVQFTKLDNQADTRELYSVFDFAQITIGYAYTWANGFNSQLCTETKFPQNGTHRIPC